MEILMDFDIGFTNKAHIICEHIPQVLERTRKRLLLSSEEVVGATHQKFGIYWDRYLVTNFESDIHGDRLLSCVLDFN